MTDQLELSVVPGELRDYNDLMPLHRVDEAVVHGGKIVLSGLPLPDGQRVQVIVTDVSTKESRSIHQVRQLLRGAVQRYDDPFEPAIPVDSWEMLK